ncbi:MAG: hypothetical protein PHP06_03535 [Clostridia bacterium]|nr:hypothetical protein [Clostridia bacterium]
MLWKFFLYGILGWLVEIVWTGMGSLLRGNWTLASHTYLWMLPVYGSAVFLEPIHNRIRRHPWISRGILWMGVILVIEYVSGWLIQQVIGVCPWDYSNNTNFSVNGFIRLDYAPAWFIAGLLFEHVHDYISKIKL